MNKMQGRIKMIAEIKVEIPQWSPTELETVSMVAGSLTTMI